MRWKLIKVKTKNLLYRFVRIEHIPKELFNYEEIRLARQVKTSISPF